MAKGGGGAGRGAAGDGDEGLGRWVARARRAAQRRGHRPTTAHLLWVLFEGDPDTQALLAHAGVGEGELLAALRDAEEPPSALDLALERAVRLAADADPSGGVMPRRLLDAVARDARSAGGRALAALGVRAGAEVSMSTARAPSRKASAPGPADGPAPRKRRGPGAMATPPRKIPKRGPRDAGGGPPPTARRRPPPSPAPPAPGKRAPGAEAEGASVRPAAPPERTTVGADPVGLEAVDAPVLASLGRDLTLAAARGALDPVRGRDAEIDRILDVLGRRRSNNPILVGPPGVGKTAVVEGLAQRLLGSSDERLRRRILVELSPASLVAGTGVRGALGDRLRSIRDEVAASDGRVLLFIDEIHALVGAAGDGWAGGADDLANALKPLLARGELPCVGATTDDEYARVFERDPALSRRFARVPIAEPSPELARGILRGLLPVYAGHHEVAYDPATVDAAVEWTVRYLPERRLPDKALAVLDVAGARARRRGQGTVDRGTLAQVVAEHAGVPVERLLSADRRRLLELEATLGERIVGQGDALARIARVIRKAAAGFRGDRPLGTFLLLGPTGVGKTETGKALAQVAFGGEGQLARFDLSEHAEAHSVARLLGAPPGYVGHGDGGQLTEAIRRRPHQVILLDEVEKAHPEVLLALLPLLDEGRLVDARGRVVDARESIVVMTSNLGADTLIAAGATAPIGFRAGSPEAVSERAEEEAARRVLEAARRALPPELWNRIDEPIVFRPLDREDAAELARRLAARLGDRLAARHGVGLEVSPAALDVLVDAGFDPALGARPLARAVGRLLEAPLAELVLGGRMPTGGRLVARPDGAGGLTFDDVVPSDRRSESYRRGLGDPGWNDPRQLTIEGA